MGWLKNLRTNTKLVVAFGAMTVLLGIVVTIAYQAINTLQNSEQQLFEKEFAGVVDIVDLRADLNRQRARLLELTLLADRKQQEIVVQDLHDRARQIDDTISRLSVTYKDDGEVVRKLQEIKITLATYRQVREEEIQQVFAGKVEDARNVSEGPQRERFEKLRALAIDLAEHLRKRAGSRVENSSKVAQESVRNFALVGGAAVLIGAVLAFGLGLVIAKPLMEVTRVAERLAAGDMTTSLSMEQRTDEVGLLSQTFARMSEAMREQISGLVEGTNVLGAAASEIVASTSQLASSASESATAVSETTTTVEEVRQTAQMTSQKAKVVSDTAQKTAQISQSGRKSAQDVVVGMDRIRQQMESIAGSMVRLSEQGQAIGQIIATVEELANQSNLLAVNAAIEAAKAGEHGKGFGVVAQEVKSLAEQSRRATTQVRGILSDIQKATTAAVMATEQGSKAVEAGSKQTEAAGDSIQSLASSVSEAAQAATQIAASSQQQLVGMEQVAQAMENIKQASAQNLASAKQLETAARSLSDLGQRLKHMVDRYKV